MTPGSTPDREEAIKKVLGLYPDRPLYAGRGLEQWAEADRGCPAGPARPGGERLEFRIVWQRKGLAKRTKLYQTREGAESFVGVLTTDPGVTEDDPYLASRYADIPPLIFGPVIEFRPVGDWGAS